MMQYTIRVAYAIVIWSITLIGDGAELIRNGSFEADDATTGRFLTDWDDGLGRGYNILEYPFGNCGDEWCGGDGGFIIPGIPANGVSGPRDRGNVYAFAFSSGQSVGGSIEFEGFAEQHMDVSEYAGRPYDFRAWIAGLVGEDNDYAVVTLQFFSGSGATGQSLASIVFDGNDQQSSFIIGSANADGLPDPSIPALQDNWTLYRATGIIPTEAFSGAVRIRGDAVSATNGVNHGFVDLVSLQVVPEPSSALLASLLASIAAACRVWRMQSPD